MKKFNKHIRNKHFVVGVIMVLLSIITSIIWSSIYAEDTALTTPVIQQIPNAPSGLSAEANSSSIALSWTDNATNEDKFNVERRASGGSWTFVTQITLPDTTSYIDTGVIAGQTYDYKVQACLSGTGCSDYATTSGIAFNVSTETQTSSGNSSGSNTTEQTNTTTQNLKPIAPTGLTATVEGNNVILRWIDNADNEAGFKIYRGPIWTDIGNVGANVTTFTDSGKAPGTYTYRLNAFNSTYMYSSLSNDVTVTVGTSTTVSTQSTSSTTQTTTQTTDTTQTSKPNAPTGLTATVEGNKVTLKWTDNSNNEAGFKIYRGPVWTDIGNVGSNVTTFIDSNRPVGTYTYHLNAFNSSYQYSAVTNDVTVTITSTTSTITPINEAVTNTTPTFPTTTIENTQTTQNVKPNAPTNLKASVEGNKVTLRWTDNSNNEAGFKIYRGPIWTDIGNVGANITTFTDTRPSGTYMYRLNAFNSSYQYSAITNDVTVTVLGTTTTVTKEETALKTETPVSPVTTTPTVSTTAVSTSTANDATKSETTSAPITPVTTEDIIKTIDVISATTPTTTTQFEQPKTEKEKEEIAKLLYQDTNKDGISDYESKYVYNIDPIKPSPVSIYQGKTITASDKILLGYDPSKNELVEVVKEEPAVSKAVEVPTYKVNEVKLEEKKLLIKGQALPNSFITVYIYSTPIMVTIKTDKNGEWEYLLDKELDNGEHTIYTATVNNSGNIVAKSTPFAFVKTAEAVSLKDIPVTQTTVQEKTTFFTKKNIFIMTVGAGLSLGIILILVGIFTKKEKES